MFIANCFCPRKHTPQEENLLRTGENTNYLWLSVDSIVRILVKDPYFGEAHDCAVKVSGGRTATQSSVLSSNCFECLRCVVEIKREALEPVLVQIRGSDLH